MIWEMQALHTHLYPSARLLQRGANAAEAGSSLQAGDLLLIEFADMSTAYADVTAVDGEKAWLKVEGYRTQRGAKIDGKTWLIQRADWLHGAHSYRIIARTFEEP